MSHPVNDQILEDIYQEISDRFPDMPDERVGQLAWKVFYEADDMTPYSINKVLTVADVWQN